MQQINWLGLVLYYLPIVAQVAIIWRLFLPELRRGNHQIERLARVLEARLAMIDPHAETVGDSPKENDV